MYLVFVELLVPMFVSFAFVCAGKISSALQVFHATTRPSSHDCLFIRIEKLISLLCVSELFFVHQ